MGRSGAAPELVKISDKRAALADCAVNAVLHVGCARNPIRPDHPVFERNKLFKLKK